jgi:hypothetical protein
MLDTQIFEWETRLTVDKGLHPNTSKSSIHVQNKLRKVIWILTLGFK